MKNIMALSLMYTESSNNSKKAFLSSSYKLHRFKTQCGVIVNSCIKN